MLLADFTKTAAEQYTKAIDYTDRLPSGATLSSVTVTATNMLTGANATATLIGSATVSGSTVRLPFQGGADGSDYFVTAAATLSNGNVLEDSLICRVRDRRI